MDIRTILYINIFLLAGCTVALSVIAFHNPRFRQFRWLAIAYATGGLSTILRMLQWHIPDFLSLVLSNMLLVAALLLVHHCFAAFVGARLRTGWLEALLIVGTFAGMVYYTHIQPDFAARSLLMSVAFLGVAALTAYVLIRFTDAAVRVPGIATATLYVVFALLTVIRCLGIIVWGAPRNFFVYSATHLMGFLGFYVLIAGIPMGYFWMTSARLYANQEQLARTDPLTGLPNRRGLEAHAGREIDYSRHHGTPLAVLAIDIDHFKRINDQYGHDVGDVALQSVARALAAVMRKEDIVARPGGEEFIALLANTDLAGASTIAERLREIVEDLDIAADDRSLRMTASFGIAVLDPGDTFESVLRRADRALYAAKLAGRNCVMLEPEPIS